MNVIAGFLIELSKKNKTLFFLCKQEYSRHCRTQSGRDVPWSDKLEFVNGWYILIIVSDTLTIIGSILKIEIESKVMKTSLETSWLTDSALSSGQTELF